MLKTAVLRRFLKGTRMNQQNTMEHLGRIRGLTESDVHRSKAQYGDNALQRGKRRSFLREFVSNFGDPIIKILLIALVVNIVIQIRHFNWYESIGIAAAILISTFVSTLSEYGSETAFEKLQEEALKTKCRVKRAGGLIEIPVGEVVVGDIVLLQAGKVSIDAGFVHVSGFDIGLSRRAAAIAEGEHVVSVRACKVERLPIEAEMDPAAVGKARGRGGCRGQVHPKLRGQEGQDEKDLHGAGEARVQCALIPMSERRKKMLRHFALPRRRCASAINGQGAVCSKRVVEGALPAGSPSG
jgi:hypothetical protein